MATKSESALEALVISAAAVIFCFFFTCVLGIAFAHAEAPRIKVSMSVVRGENAVSLTEAREIFRKARAIFAEEVGVNVVLVKSRSISAPKSAQLAALSSAIPQASYWSIRFSKTRVGGVIDLAVLPPYKANGLYYFAGAAWGQCSLYSSFAFVALPRIRSNGELGERISKYVIAHELAHLMGAPHVGSQTIMNPAPSQALEELGEIHFDALSVRDMRLCLNEWGKL